LTKKNENGGDPFPEPQPYGDSPLRRRLRRRPSLLAIGVLCSLALSGFTLLGVSGALGRQAFPGSSLVSISASYALGSSPNSIVLSPGTSTNFTLTIQSFSTQTVRVSYDVSAAGDRFSYTAFGFPTVQQDLTMTIGQTIVAPSNGSNAGNANFGTCNCVTVDVPASLTAGQQTVSSGSLALAGSADPTALPSFSISWYASPA